MAKKQSQSKQRAQGGGRTANSEPRLQVFKDFGGCNFELSPHEFKYSSITDYPTDPEQTDLQMNFFVIQNNIWTTSNKTMETRNNVVKLFSAPAGKEFTDAAVMISNELYVATADGEIYYGDIVSEEGKLLTKKVELANKTGSKDFVWESLDYYDDKLIGATDANELWTGAVSEHKIANAAYIDDPSPLSMSNLEAIGSLKITTAFDNDHPYRTDIAFTYVNKYGPTNVSDSLTFYSNTPVSEWHSGCYLRVSGNIPSTDVLAIELYYSADNASSMIFAGRTDVVKTDTTWVFNWIGYLDATTMWTTANLITPTENYTKGVPVSRMCNIDGRMYFWGSKDDPYRLYIGGNPGNLFSVSSGTGGGFVDIEPGTGQEIRYVCKYKTQSGNSIVTMLCDSKNSRKEQRFNLVENTITVSNEQNMKSWQAEQVSGAVGCKSFYGAKACADGLYSVSRYGVALTTMTMEYNSQIRTNYISDPIKPVFTNTLSLGEQLKNSILLELDGVLYLALANENTGKLDDLLFCYDINLKAWWTYSLNLKNENIIDMIHIDYEGHREGIGFITEKAVYLLPTTDNDKPVTESTCEVLLETGELSPQIPQQSWQYLSQIEFRFDYFLGDITITLAGIDQFGRTITVEKKISHDTTVYNDSEYMRVDLRLQSYKLRIEGTARFRMTHFISKLYTMSSKIGLVWGFDDKESYRTSGDIHPTFKDYNDIKKAIIV